MSGVVARREESAFVRIYDFEPIAVIMVQYYWEEWKIDSN